MKYLAALGFCCALFALFALQDASATPPPVGNHAPGENGRENRGLGQPLKQGALSSATEVTQSTVTEAVNATTTAVGETESATTEASATETTTTTAAEVTTTSAETTATEVVSGTAVGDAALQTTTPAESTAATTTDFGDITSDTATTEASKTTSADLAGSTSKQEPTTDVAPQSTATEDSAATTTTSTEQGTSTATSALIGASETPVANAGSQQGDNVRSRRVAPKGVSRLYREHIRLEKLLIDRIHRLDRQHKKLRKSVQIIIIIIDRTKDPREHRRLGRKLSGFHDEIRHIERQRAVFIRELEALRKILRLQRFDFNDFHF